MRNTDARSRQRDLMRAGLIQHTQSQADKPKRQRRFSLKPILYAALAFVWAGLGGLDPVLDGSLWGAARNEPSEASAHAPYDPGPWIVDIDGDGRGDYANPCEGAVRGRDKWGSGAFEARRDAGKRRHHGVDFVVAPGADVRAPIAGEVVRFGPVYRDGSALTYVEIENAETKITARVFYVDPSAKLGERVAAGGVIGRAQDLEPRYPGITNHVHVELRDAENVLLDAAEHVPLYPVRRQARVATPAPART